MRIWEAIWWFRSISVGTPFANIVMMVLKIDKDSDGRVLVLRLSGRLQSKHLKDLNEQMEGSLQRIILDLEDVKLVDREAVCFLAACEMKGAELRRCSLFIREWIRKEREFGNE